MDHVDITKAKLSPDNKTYTRHLIVFLVFRKKDLYLIITQKLTFMKSGGFHLKSTHNLIKSDVSTKTIQFDECRRGAMTLDFTGEIRVKSG